MLAHLLAVSLVSSAVLGADPLLCPYPERLLEKADPFEPAALLAGDFHGEGRTDLVVLHSKGLTLLRNEGVIAAVGGPLLQMGGDIRFQESTLSADLWSNRPLYPLRLLASGDFSGDGKADIAVVSGDTELHLLAGQGGGGFARAAEFRFGAITCVEAADLEGDGRDELLACVVEEGSLSRRLLVFSAEPGGSFSGEEIANPPSSPSWAVALEGPESRRYLAVTSDEGGYFSIAPLDPDGTPVAWESLEELQWRGPGMAAADLDGDGASEVALWGEGGAYLAVLWPQRRLETLHEGWGVSHVVALSPRLAIANNSRDALLWLEFGADLTLKEKTIYSCGSHPLALAAGDFDDDGARDVAVSLQGEAFSDERIWGAVTIARALGGGLVLPVNHAPTAHVLREVALHDLDGDGDRDALATGVATLDILEREGGSWVPRQTIESTETVGGLELADLNGDGFADIVAVCSRPEMSKEDSIKIFLSQGPLGHANPKYIRVGENPVAAGLDDINGDGILDIAVALHGCSCWPDNEAFLAILLGTGNAEFSEPEILPCGHYANDLVILDLDGDGAKDILVAASDPITSPGALFFAGKGDGTYLPGAKFPLPEVWRILRADVDGDGAEELVFYAAQVAYCEPSLEGLARPRIVDLGLSDPYSYLGALAVADADRDGVPDVLLSSGYSYDSPSDKVLLYRGLGGGEFSEPTAFLSGNGATNIHFGPVDPGGPPVAVLSGSLYEHATNFLVALPSSIFGISMEFLRGDANGDRQVDLSDAVSTLMHLFLGGRSLCQDAGDANDDGILNITDPVFVLNYLFLGGTEPPWPFPDRGWDPTPDDLGCVRYPS